MRRIQRSSVGIVLAATIGFGFVGVAVGADPPRAFPGAYGYGTETPGGRGGAVLAVTTLADSGPGSLREAVTTPGPRLIVFRVAGEIRLKSHLRVTEPFCTIAGQTAPGSGITLRDAGFYIQTHDVVARFLHSRVGPSLVEKFNTQDAIQISGEEPYNVVVDHCSFSWSIDECVGVRGPGHDITLCWNIISEALRQPFTKEQIGKERSHSMAMILGGEPTRCSVHHNLLAHCNSRNPRIQGGRHDFINNVVYDWGWLTGTFSRDPEVNFIANDYKRGPSSLPLKAITEKADQLGKVYVKGNRSYERPNDSLPEWDPIVNAPAAEHRALEPFAMAPIPTSTPEEAYHAVLDDAGATLPCRDPIDRRVVRDVRLGMGEKIDRPDEVGGYAPVIPGQAPPDTDGDGMPDDWERKNGFDPEDPADGNADADHDGYTNVEAYLQWLVERRLDRPNTVRALERPAGTGDFAVTTPAGALPVVRVPGASNLSYVHAAFSGEVAVRVQPRDTVDAVPVMEPPRYAGGVSCSESGVTLVLNEEGPRILRYGEGRDAKRLCLFFDPMPQAAPAPDTPGVILASEYGVAPRGGDVTGPLQRALDACGAQPGGGVVVVEAGRYPITSVRIPSGVTLYLGQGAELHAMKRGAMPSLIAFEGTRNAALVGPGVIDGCHQTGAEYESLVLVHNAESIRIADVLMRDPAGIGINLRDSDDVQIERVKLVTAASGDPVGGLRIDTCRNVTCFRSFIASTGDGMSVTAGGAEPPRATEAVTLRENVIRADGIGVRIGPRTPGGVRDVFLRDNDVLGAATGIVIERGGPGGIENITVRDTTFDVRPDLATPWGGRLVVVADAGGAATGLVRNILFDRITGNTHRPIQVIGRKASPLGDVRFWGVRVRADKCLLHDSDKPAALFSARHVDGLQLRFVYVTWPGADRGGWSTLLDTDAVVNLKAEAGEIFETTAAGEAPGPP
jgi:pectate lyase